MRSLVLFFELSSSLEKFERHGLLRRNLMPYEKFLDSGAFNEVYVYSSDDRDRAKLAQLKRDQGVSDRIRVLTPPRFLRSRIGAIIYSLVGPFMHRKVLSAADVLKTHQVSGSWTPLIAKLLYGKPLLFRVGYPLSIRFKAEGKAIKYALARLVEKLLVHYSDHVAVSSQTMQRYYSDLSKDAKVTVLPSYVDVSGFKPVTDYDARRPILFIGRLDPVKNLDNLIRACARVGMPLHIYGGGPLEGQLKELAHACGAAVEFKGVVPNAELARVHHDHTIYVLCSTREGMPKALIEAMASGLICVGSRTDGNLELIEEGRTGYLIDGYDADAIEAKLRWVMASFDPEVGRRASALVRKNNSLEHANNLELAILEDILASRRPPNDRSFSKSADDSLGSPGRSVNPAAPPQLNHSLSIRNLPDRTLCSTPREGK